MITRYILSILVFISFFSTLSHADIDQLNSRLSDPTYKVLFLARHAKASKKNKFSQKEKLKDLNKAKLDKERPLTKKGKKNAKDLAEIMSALNIDNVGIWGSDAKRVKDTAQHFSDTIEGNILFEEYTPELYYADIPKDLKVRLTTKEHNKDLQQAIFWGHGQTTSELFLLLTGASEAFLPTAGIFIIALKAQSWEQVFKGEATNIESFGWSPNDSHEAKDLIKPLIDL